MKFPIYIILSLFIFVNAMAQSSVESTGDSIIFHDKNYPILNSGIKKDLLQGTGYSLENSTITIPKLNKYILLNNLPSLKTNKLSTGFNSFFSETSIRQFNGKALLYYHVSWNLAWRQEIYKGWNLSAGIAPSFCYYVKMNNNNTVKDYQFLDTSVLLNIDHKFKNGTEASLNYKMGVFHQYGLLNGKFKFK